VIDGQLQEIFRSVLCIPDLTLSEELTADEVPGWDSISHVRLMVAVEETFKVSFSASQLAMLENVGDLKRLVRSLIEQKEQRRAEPRR
jgi:acyl carrier protein